MTTRPKIAEHNIETDEIIVREMNDAEFAQHELDHADAMEFVAQQEAKESARLSAKEKLAALGLTAEEIAAL
jgi:3-isopropylmalate dehydratase small subunit